MKKIISLMAALAMVASIFATAVSATVPASFTLTADVNEATSAQVNTYLNITAVKNLISEIPSGYTLYTIDFSQTGLGNWENEGDDDAPTGYLPSVISVKLSFGDDYAKIYNPGTSTNMKKLMVSRGGIGLTVNTSSSAKTITLQKSAYSPGATYHIAGGESIDEGESFGTLYLLVADGAEATLASDTTVGMSRYADGEIEKEEGVDTVNYKISNGRITGSPATLEFTSAPTTYDITFMNADGSATVSTVTGLAAGDAIVPPTAPAASTGYTFAGWSSTQGGTPDLPATASASGTYYAVYSEIPVTGIIFGQSSYSGEVGTNVTVSASVDPSTALVQTITFSGTGVTDNGDNTATVTSAAAGNVVVTATAGSVSDTVTVTFTNATIPVTGVTISGPVKAKVGDVVTLTATVDPSTATDPTVSWDNATKVDDTTATVTSAVAGDVVVTATAGSISETYTVTFIADAPAVVTTNENSAAVKGGINFYTTHAAVDAPDFTNLTYKAWAKEAGSEEKHYFDAAGQTINELVSAKMEVAGAFNFILMIKSATRVITDCGIDTFVK